MNQRSLKIALVGVVVAIYGTILFRAFGTKDQNLDTEVKKVPHYTNLSKSSPTLLLAFNEDIWQTPNQHQKNISVKSSSTTRIAIHKKRGSIFKPTVHFPVMKHIGYIKATNQSLATAIVSDERGRLVYLSEGSAYRKDFRVTAVTQDSISISSKIQPDTTLILYRLAQG